MDSAGLVAAWRDIINSPDKSWVLFENGTCVVLMAPSADLAGQAVELLREHGPVYPGSSFGDFGTITLDDGRGWVVTFHHNDILTYVAPGEVGKGSENDLAVGPLGRSKRGQDADELRVVHVEDRSNRG